MRYLLIKIHATSSQPTAYLLSLFP